MNIEKLTLVLCILMSISLCSYLCANEEKKNQSMLPYLGLGTVSLALLTSLYQPDNPDVSHNLPQAAQNRIKTIVFDLDGVLCKTNKLKAFQAIGINPTMSYIGNKLYHLDFENWLPTEKPLFNALSGIPAKSTYHSFNKGLPMPAVMVDIQTNAQSPQAIRQAMLDYFAQSDIPQVTQQIAINTINMMLDPERFVHTRELVPQTVALLHALKTAGYKLYVLSNWDAASFPVFQAQYPELFKLNNEPMFDGIMISGNVHTLKPEPSIFKKFVKTYHIKKEETLFIDDEPANIQGSQPYFEHTLLANLHDGNLIKDEIVTILQNNATQAK